MLQGSVLTSGAFPVNAHPVNTEPVNTALTAIAAPPNRGMFRLLSARRQAARRAGVHYGNFHPIKDRGIAA